MSDAVNKPAHYNQGSIECIEAMKIVLTPEEYRGYLKGNVFKYLWREKDKNGNEDLRKGKSYYDWLIELIDEYEQQKAADIQSLKDYPFGKLKEPAWTPQIGDWVRIKKPSSDKRDSVLWSSFMDEHDKEVVQVKEIKDGAMVHGEWFFPFDWLEPADQPKAPLNSDTIPEGYRKLNDSSIEPRQLGDLCWSVSEKRYVEISVDEIGYANLHNWAACRKVTAEVDAEWVDAVWPQDWGKPARFWPNPICQDEGTPDYKLWDLGTVAGYVADGYRKWIIEMDGKISCQMCCQVKKNAESVIKQSLNTEPPDGWRILEEGEVIRDGDKPIFPGGEIKELPPSVIGKKHERPCRAYCHYIRRNRFEVGEKVVYIPDQSVWTYVSEINDGPNHPKSAHIASGSTSLRACVTRLAPYIEETK
jgi:hypothetical protein